ncbi:MAG: FAD-dependent thymidylate synthase [Planctomycetota bacterium]
MDGTLARIRLVNYFTAPIEAMAAAARTCYSSKGAVEIEEIKSSDKKYENALKILKTIFQAGHHTVIQHIHFQFLIENVSRQFVWSFLHSHPFYNSEQVSQRYVEVKRENVFIPPVDEALLTIYLECVNFQIDAYRKLIDMLTDLVADEYYKRFPRRKNNSKYNRDIKRKAQEIARYVLPLGTLTYLYHTISAITLIRYYRMMSQLDTGYEQKAVVEEMVRQVISLDRNMEIFFKESYRLEETVEYPFMNFNIDKKEFKEEFDKDMDNLSSKLVCWNENAEQIIYDAVREVLGLSRRAISLEEAIDLIMNPVKNRYLASAVEVLTLSKLSRVLYNSHYVFKKRMSHCADSQDQRHRMTPASRPALTLIDYSEPDYIIPSLIQHDEKALKFYKEVMDRIWNYYNMFLKRGGSREFALYILPNSLVIRYTESADALNLLHKLKSRLCYNAQEEIWRASLEEAVQIQKVHPNLGRYLLAPCFYRMKAGITPFCPEGERYCGMPVWKYSLGEYKRLV